MRNLRCLSEFRDIEKIHSFVGFALSGYHQNKALLHFSICCSKWTFMGNTRNQMESSIRMKILQTIFTDCSQWFFTPYSEQHNLVQWVLPYTLHTTQYVLHQLYLFWYNLLECRLKIAPALTRRWNVEHSLKCICTQFQ